MVKSNEHANAPGVLDDREREAVEATFGVGVEQVRRDHAISHALAAISTIGTQDVVFFGGTALSRTHLSDLRLSEDIDLIALSARTDVADRIQGAVSRQLRRTFGAVAFTPRLGATREPAPSVMDIAGSRVQVQLLSSIGYPAWPTEVLDIYQRYSDAPPARLRVLTAEAFAAAKLAAWHDRGTPRDLYDLWALAELGSINFKASALFARFGPITQPSRVTFTSVPTDAEWDAALSHQCIPKVSPFEAAAVVREAWSQL